MLYGQRSGRVHVEWLLVQVSDGSLWLGLATLLRVLAIGLPAVVLFAQVDPTDFADGLAQVLHLPARFVLGAFAGIRLAGLFADDRRALELARRARGVADRGRLRRLAGLAFALFVLSIRRGSALATAMEARGFGGDVRRTWARPSRFGLPRVRPHRARCRHRGRCHRRCGRHRILELHRRMTIDLASLAARAAASGPRPVVLIDGRSGAGKTTLARDLAPMLGAQLVSLDDIYPGWAGLEAGSAAVARDGAARSGSWLAPLGLGGSGAGRVASGRPCPRRSSSRGAAP